VLELGCRAGLPVYVHHQIHAVFYWCEVVSSFSGRVWLSVVMMVFPVVWLSEVMFGCIEGASRYASAHMLVYVVRLRQPFP